MKTAISEPLTIGNLTIPNRAILAPLARVSDIPYRRICQQMGAGLTYIEMLSAGAVLRYPTRKINTLSRHSSEAVLGIQITGKEPEEIGKACAWLQAEGFNTVDINMGCPVKKVVTKGWGSAILRDIDRLEKMVRAGREAITNIPFSIKIRTGYCGHTVNVSQTAPLIASLDVDMLTIHGRTRAERYDVPADLKMIDYGFQLARKTATRNLVTVGNGDVMDKESAERMMAQTGCDAVMISRGALGNPWIFGEVCGTMKEQPTIQEWMDVVLRHLDLHAEFHGENRMGNVTFRKHLLWYCTGFPGMRKKRHEFGTLPDLDATRAAIKAVAASLPRNLRRFEDMDPNEATAERSAEYDPKYEMDREADRPEEELEET